MKTSALSEFFKLADIDISGVKAETAMAAQPQPMETNGLTKAFSIIDRATKIKTSGAFASPSLSLKATRQVGTVKNSISSMKGGSFGAKVPNFGQSLVKEPGMATSKLKLGTNHFGEEEVARVRATVSNRNITREVSDAMFENAKDARGKERAKMHKLFIQAPVAQTMAPVLQKTSAVSGAVFPDEVMDPDEPYSRRLNKYKSYVKAKSKEQKTTYRRAMTTGGAIGAGLGGVVGLAYANPLAGALMGAGLGALAGAGAAIQDHQDVDEAKRAAKIKNVHRAMSDTILHIAAMEKISSISPSVDAFFEKFASSDVTEAQRNFPELLQVKR